MPQSEAVESSAANQDSSPTQAESSSNPFPLSMDQGFRQVLEILRQPTIMVLAGLLFLVPLLRWSGLEDSFNTPKTTLLLFGLVVLGAQRIWSAFRPSSPADIPNLPNGLYFQSLVLWGLFGGLQLASVVWSDSKALAISGLIHLLTGLSVLFLTSVTVRRPGDAAVLLTAGTAAAVITAGWTVMEDAMAALGITNMVRRLPDWRGFLGAGLGNSGHIAGWCGLFLFPLLAIHCFLRKSSLITLLGVILVFLAMVVTWSVGSTGSSLLSLAVWLVIAWRSGALASLPWSRTATVVTCGFMAIGFYFLNHPANPHKPSLLTEAFSSQRWKDGLPTRQVIYETSLEMVRQRPLLGWGVGNFTVHYVQQKPMAVHSNPALLPYAGAYTNDAHNDAIQVTTETGVLGLTIVVLAVALGLLGIFSQIRHPATSQAHRMVLLCCGCGITVFLLDGLMSFPSRLPAHWMAFMAFFGIAAGLSRTVPVVQAAPPRALGWFVPTLFLTLGLVALPWQARRVLAEHSLKTARSEADSIPIWVAQGPVPAWDGLQFYLNMMTEAILMQQPELLQQASKSARNAIDRPDLARVLGNLARAERFDRHYTNGTSRRSVALMAQGRWQDASNLLERIQVSLQSTEILDRWALCKYMLGDGPGASVLWRELAARQPLSAPRYLRLAEMALLPKLPLTVSTPAPSAIP